LVEYLFHDFIELHGDRTYGDDKALIGGIGFLDDIPVTVIAQERGSTVEERQARNHAMLHPEGYRKAKRLALQAERFHRPVVCVVDTPGAYPGIGAEERGQAEAIAQCLLCFSALKTPVISIIMGQGGSGGALALSTADRLLMFENATFSVISPEGFASIYWKDASRAKEAAEIMKMTARDIAAFGVVDAIIPEHAGGLQCDPEYSFAITRERLTWMLMDLLQQPPETLVENRRHKLRHTIDLSFV
jgi:acetyl-CoA carboxylase carboxyl transferase subunit alpha